MFYRAGPNVRWAAISVCRGQLQEAAIHTLGRALELPRRGVWNVSPSPAFLEKLNPLVRLTVQDSAVHPRFWDSLGSEPILLQAYAEAIDSASRDNHDRCYHGLFIRGDRLMRQQIGTRYSSEALCQTLGVSERNLQIHFRRAVGLSPKAWFHRLEFHRARRELLRRKPEPGVVSRVAIGCGFDHFGRFSEGYRDLFGESPSETLQDANLQHE